ncbi:glycosyltransferase family 2 protein [Candidatus Tisiphia endosymbiont of Mystacides longicornis]|uniref:glycosyltransferase family 2 protein n=1 Tax=Candidatus Tisiphia endosymbiont of Mystacides longicornis TaxID=3139330 RepID=UPI003CCA9E0C
MDGYIRSLNIEFLDILAKEQLVTDLQISHIKLKLAENDFFNTIIEEGIINNEMIIEILYKYKLLPLLSVQESQVKIYDYSKIDQYVRNGYFIYENDESNEVLAINDLAYLGKLSAIHYNVQIKLVRKNDFYQLLERNFSHLNIIKSKYFLEFLSLYMIAKNINYTKSIIIFFLIYFAILLNFKHLFHIINIICYFSQNILKIILFNQAAITPDTIFKISDLYSNDSLPIYTILLPLYQESGKLKSIISCITNINYPKHKLDVKIIVEADDYLMIKESILYELPSYIHLIKVPFTLPRTKPKALNYAMQYCKGKYVVIYDAEDRPDTDQLLKAVIAFDSLPKEYVCLQAKLNFYNENENLLTKLFSIEYCLWFKYLLKGLSLMNLPVTLGGTSNHFKVDALQKIGFWDAYNVTEDADLGIRLYSFGYKVHMIDSYTLEESPIDIINWINQRSRWIKGFIQTFLVFLAQKDKYKRFKFYQIITIFIFIGFSSYGFCCVPFLIITIKINKLAVVNYLWIVNSFFAFSYLYGSAFFILLSKKGKITNFRVLDVAALLVWPLYFLLHTIASYKAIWQIVFMPFKWDKTQHGISTIDLE